MSYKLVRIFYYSSSAVRHEEGSLLTEVFKHEKRSIKEEDTRIRMPNEDTIIKEFDEKVDLDDLDTFAGFVFPRN